MLIVPATHMYGHTRITSIYQTLPYPPKKTLRQTELEMQPHRHHRQKKTTVEIQLHRNHFLFNVPANVEVYSCSLVGSVSFVSTTVYGHTRITSIYQTL